MEKELKLLQAKLRRPVHISFISEYILDKDMDSTRKIINALKVLGYVVESDTAEDYYKINNEKFFD
jgi:hypothetical protein